MGFCFYIFTYFSRQCISPQNKTYLVFKWIGEPILDGVGKASQSFKEDTKPENGTKLLNRIILYIVDTKHANNYYRQTYSNNLRVVPLKVVRGLKNVLTPTILIH